MINIYEFFNSPFFNSILTGVSVGIGSTIGAWMIKHHFIDRLERLEKQLGDKIRH
jgi:hypothetical protein